MTSPTTNSSPFVPSSASIARVMGTVLLALVPGILIYIVLFGWGLLNNILITTLSALVFELLMLVLRDRPVRVFLLDGSAVVTAVLLALTLPPLAPWWIPVLGSFIAIVVAKHLYGGIGYNSFNPAMAAYAVLLVSFPLEMSIWAAPQARPGESLDFIQHWQYLWSGTLPASTDIDALSSATLLDHMRTEVAQGKSLAQIQQSATFGLFAGSGYEWVNLGFLAGGLFLLYKKIISWHIPFSMLIALAMIAGICYLLDPTQFASPLVHLFSGASILGAFFIATDPVTASTTPIGRIIYACGIGLLTYVIRNWGGYPDGVAFAVLLIGLTVPLLDYYTAPKVYGARVDYEKS